ncbi:type II secretion system protein [bacterium]|nr:MAG: type II secretion system protein [bacterium]
MRTRGGFTLIELVLVISIVALLIMAVGLTSGVRENAKVHSAAESVKTLRTAAESYIAAGNMTYTGITVAGLQTLGYLPAAFSAIGSNPWGGNYAIAPNTDANKVDISLTGVSSFAAVRLSALFVNSAAATNYASNTWTITF